MLNENFKSHFLKVTLTYYTKNKEYRKQTKSIESKHRV